MSLAHLIELDLNLLLQLDALLDETSLTRAAGRVGLTQPAMSRALARLRLALKDPLFVRSGRSLVPTPHAVALRPRLREALLLLEQTVTSSAVFDASTSRRRFHLATADTVEAIVLPALVARLQHEAPGVDVVVHPLVTGTTEALASGKIDVVVGPRRAAGEGLVRTTMFTDELVCIVRRDHPSVKARLSLDQYCSLGHVLVTPSTAPSSIVDDALARRGKARRVVLRTPSFLVAPILVESSDLVSTIGKRIARFCAARQAIRLLPAPLELPFTSVSMTWHERMRRDPGHAWFRRLLADVARPRPL